MAAPAVGSLSDDNRTMQPAKQLFVHTPLLQQE